MITVENLTFAYGAREVLRGVSFDVRPGTCAFLLGANGAGKTTLFRCMLGALTGYGGRIMVSGRDIAQMPPAKLAEHVAYIPQIYSSAFAYTALDVVLMGMNRRISALSSPGKREYEEALDALDMLGAAQLADRSMACISGGERQLVLIARAIAQRAGTLLMDEPTSSLDFGNQIRVLECVRSLADSGYTVLISSHQPQHVMSFADQVLALRDGRMIANGTAEEVMDEVLLHQLYGIDVSIVSSPYGNAIVPKRMTNRRKP